MRRIAVYSPRRAALRCLRNAVLVPHPSRDFVADVVSIRAGAWRLNSGSCDAATVGGVPGAVVVAARRRRAVRREVTAEEPVCGPTTRPWATDLTDMTKAAATRGTEMQQDGVACDCSGRRAGVPTMSSSLTLLKMRGGRAHKLARARTTPVVPRRGSVVCLAPGGTGV